MRRADAQAARDAATKLLSQFSIRNPPIPVERIIKAHNIVLQYVPLAQELSGMAYIKDGVAIIGVNALHHPNRQRFSAAHELAHHMLHRTEITSAVHVDKGFRVLHRDEITAQGTDPLEIDANAFASELLMPRHFISEAVGQNGLDLDDEPAVETLAKKFRVSGAAMRNRLGGSWF